MGRACSAHGRDKKCIQNFGWKTQRRDDFANLDIDGRMTLKQRDSMEQCALASIWLIT
jgi:hypothetical protein